MGRPQKNFEARLTEFLKLSSFHTSLPAALFDLQGTLVFANERMHLLLSKNKGDFPFSNEERAGPALFKALLGPKAPDQSLRGALGLKTYKLSTKKYPKDGLRLFVAELQRSGDLLVDRDSRQTLFRSIAHEVRTSVTALQGYLQMLDRKGQDKMIVERMEVSVERLAQVVERLKDFRSEIEGDDDTKD